MLDHIHKVKAIAYQLACLEVLVKNEDIVMTLLESLSSLYKHFNSALEMMPMKKLTMKYVSSCLMHKTT